RRNATSSGVDGASYSAAGNSWAPMSPAPPAFGTGQAFKSGAGLFAATDGASSIWLFAVNTDTANSILYTKYNGTTWSPWATVPGTFVYTPAAGVVLPAGAQTLSVVFTPADTASFTSASATVAIPVTKATPTITWVPPAGITFGTPLGAGQLNASASVAGTF